MSDSRSPSSSKGPPPPARNLVELILVRGLIVALLVAVAIEAIQWNSHKSAVAGLAKKLKAVEDDPKIPEVTESDIKAALGTKQPTRTEQYPGGVASPASKKLEVYSWFSLNPGNKRELWVHFARKGLKEEGPAVVIAVSTDDQDPKPVEHVEESGTAASGPPGGSMGAGGPPGMMGGGPGGGGRRGAQGRPGVAPADGEAKPDADAPKTGDEKATHEKTADEKSAPEEKKPDDKPESGDK